ncbi:MAG TPA: glycosyltransferase family 4 protein [Candidatus Cybelea sp.]|jgi:glycosyltransferase involved in cell wall biosynthesis|nr:glycosyltransferase family 4 protein [Candidatus Cybelea sp.]
MISETRKRIAIFSQFCDPEPCAASNRVASLARTLAQRGHEVTVVTGMPSFPKGVVEEPYRGLKCCVEYDGPVRILRRRAPLAPPGARGGRLRNWLSLALVLSWTALTQLRRIDTIIVSSPPITMALPALLAAWRHRAPLVVDVRDVFPDMGVRLGVWSPNGFVYRVLRLLVKALYSRAAIVVAVTESARESILHGGASSRSVVLAPNGYDFSIPVAPRQRPERSGFEVVYAGNMGLATGLDVILDAAKLLRDRSDVRFILAGGGVDADRLAARIENESLSNVRFVGVLSRRKSLELLAAADATIVPLHGGLVDAIPSKMFDALAIGCPMILSARGEAVRLLQASGCGLHVEPNDAGALAEGVLRCFAERELLESKAAFGQAFVREKFDRERIMAGLARRIGALA